MRQSVCFTGPDAQWRTTGIPLPDPQRPAADVPIPPPAPPPVVVVRAGAMAPLSAPPVAPQTVPPNLSRRPYPTLTMRQVAASAGALGAILFLGCYTGHQVHQFLQSETSEQNRSVVAIESLEKVPPAETVAHAANHVSEQPAVQLESPEAAALFAAVSAGMARPGVSESPAATQVAGTSASPWRRLEESLPLPEPPIERSLQIAAIPPAQLGTSPADACSTEDCDECAAPGVGAYPDNRLGTTIEWHSDYEEARQLAESQGKLLFVMCISGDFTDPGFT